MKRNLAFSFSSWFCVPELGMKDFEILCRASCFIVPTITPKQNYKYHVLTVSHAAAPFRWPKLYPDDWLQSVSEKNVIYTMEPRHADGMFVAQRHLLPHVYLHPTRDLAVLHLEDEEQSLSMFRNQLKHAFETRLDFVDENIVKGEPGGSELTFHGHTVEAKAITEVDDRLMIPRVESGVMLGRTAKQVLYRTKNVLVDGMCGGPVCEDFDHAPFANGRKKIVRGLLEGIVPANHPSPDIQNAAVFVESGEIRDFLRQIEAEAVEPLRVGDVSSIVAADQDPEKLDFTKYL